MYKKSYLFSFFFFVLIQSQSAYSGAAKQDIINHAIEIANKLCDCNVEYLETIEESSTFNWLYLFGENVEKMTFEYGYNDVWVSKIIISKEDNTLLTIEEH
jgi:hypothetical protein